MTTRRAAATLVLAACAAAWSRMRAAPGSDELTLRWIWGPPIWGGPRRIGAAALQNAPFLRAPEILSVEIVESRYGPEDHAVAIRLGPGAAAVFAREAAEHPAQQMLVMIGDEVLVAPRVFGRPGADLVLHVGYGGAELRRLVRKLREGAGLPARSHR